MGAAAAMTLLVADDPAQWPIGVPGIAVVAARSYLMDAAYGELRGVKVFNLCASYRYQSLGYYVSLLGEARGHKMVPRIASIEDLKSSNLVRLATEGLDGQVQRSLAAMASETDAYEMNVFFGRSAAGDHDSLCRELFARLQVPLLHVRFERRSTSWRIRSVTAISVGDLGAEQQAFAVRAASEYFIGRRRGRRHPAPRFELAILHDPENPEPPSNPVALCKFEQAAAAVGMQPELITRADARRLGEFDALFIRDTTFANHYTYRLSRQAEAEGLVVIDDADSILKCNNKVYLTELLGRHGVPMPRSMLVLRETLHDVVAALGFPCILKQPDSSFSLGVVKVDNEDELMAKAEDLLAKSELIIAQEFRPTAFDWRVGILGRRPLFVCKYFMAPDHWQIVKHGETRRDYVEGPTEALALTAAPEQVLKLALKAANLIGDGFYGVDLKQDGDGCCVIEVNDNPNVDAGNEDGVLQDALYQQIMADFVRRLDERGQRPG
jgi:glutathione synthase/RimK-type ligase-like ATP-grasp enzyme